MSTEVVSATGTAPDLGWFGQLIDGASHIVQSPFALAVILIVLLFVLVFALWQLQRRMRREMKLVIKQVTRDEIECLGFMSSAVSIAREQRLLIEAVTGPPNRHLPPVVSQLDRKLEELTSKIHIARNEKIARLNDDIKQLSRMQEEEGLI